jgi:hypothetical protein
VSKSMPQKRQTIRLIADNGKYRHMATQYGTMAALTAIFIVSLVATAVAGTIDDAKASIRHHLIIPGSARFYDLHERGDYICGKVDAKTRAGTYDSARVMIYNIKTQLSTIVDGSNISMEMTDTMKRDLDHACS